MYISVCVYVHMSAGACRGQEASDLPELELKADGCGCWEMNSDPLEEQ